MSTARALPANEAAIWAKRVNDLHSECGCALGARFFFASVLIYPAIWYWLLRPVLPSVWYALLVGVPVLFVAAVLGKLTGILTARFRLVALNRKLKARLTEHLRGINA